MSVLASVSLSLSESAGELNELIASKPVTERAILGGSSGGRMANCEFSMLSQEPEKVIGGKGRR